MTRYEAVIKAIKILRLKDPYLAKEVSISNIRRIYGLAIMMSVVHITCIIAFWLKAADTPVQQEWRLGIMTTHAIMLVVILAAAFICLALDRKKLAMSPAAYIVQRFVVLAYMVFGAALCAIDQLVTTAITPYMIACIALAVTMLNRPIDSIIDYTLAYIVLFNAVQITQTNNDVLLSVQVNGISTTGLALGLSIILWRTNIQALQQKKLIENQKIELQEKNRQLQMIAAYDSLTGLINRMQFIQLAENEVARMRRSGNPTGLMVMDIDHFKEINDKYGHPGGDAILKQIAQLIKQHLRASDIPARLGGDEFIILLPETSLLSSAKVAGKLRQSIESNPFEMGDDHVFITASFGVTNFAMEDPEPFKAGYQAADQALYQAKENGRNRVEIG